MITDVRQEFAAHNYAFHSLLPAHTIPGGSFVIQSRMPADCSALPYDLREAMIQEATHPNRYGKLLGYVMLLRGWDNDGDFTLTHGLRLRREPANTTEMTPEQLEQLGRPILPYLNHYKHDLPDAFIARLQLTTHVAADNAHTQKAWLYPRLHGSRSFGTLVAQIGGLGSVVYAGGIKTSRSNHSGLWEARVPTGWANATLPVPQYYPQERMLWAGDAFHATRKHGEGARFTVMLFNLTPSNIDSFSDLFQDNVPILAGYEQWFKRRKW